ncbi:MAG: hypothetical protein C5S41_01370 [Candidatus Methanomarinus sp.]|nr:MAG: hypothetical protein C5S41_01370 [ANME-2 cluster archaeon]
MKPINVITGMTIVLNSGIGVGFGVEISAVTNS